MIDLKAALAPFADIKKREPAIIVDLSKVAAAVAKAVDEVPTEGDTSLGMLLLEKQVCEVDSFLSSVTHDPSTDRLVAPGSSLAKRFEADVVKAKAAPFPKKGPDGKHVFESESGESTGGTATAMRAPAKKAQQPAHDEDVGEPGMLMQTDEQTPQQSGEISTALRGKKPTKKNDAEIEKASGAETPVTEDYDYSTRGAGRPKPPTAAEQAATQYTAAGAGVADDGPKSEGKDNEYEHHEGGKPSDYDFGRDAGGPNAAGAPKGGKKALGAKAQKAESEMTPAEKAQYDLSQQGAVDELDRKKPDPTKTNAKDTEPQPVDQLGKGKGGAKKAVPGQNDQQSEFDEVDDRSSTKAEKGKGKDGDADDKDEESGDEKEPEDEEETKKKGEGDDEPVDKSEVSWAADMSPRQTRESRSARLTKSERPIPARSGTRKNLEKYDRARERMMSGGEDRVTK